MATIKDLFDNIKTQSSNAAEKVLEFGRGLRGGATSTGNTPWTSRNPNVPDGPKLSPEATQHITNKVAQDQKFAQAAQKSKPAAAGGGALRGGLAGAAALGGVSAAYDAYKHGNLDQDYAMADTPVGKLLTGGPITLASDSFAHATSPIRAGMVGAGRRFLKAFGVGGDEAQAAPNAVTKAPIANDVDAELRAGEPMAPVENDMIDTTRGGLRTPQQIISGTDVPVFGQGAFQRTTPGNMGTATKVGARMDKVTPGAESGIRARTPLGMVAAGLTKVKAAQARDSGILAEGNLAIKNATANATVAKTAAELEKGRGEAVDKHIENEVLRSVEPTKINETQGDYKARVERARGEFASRIAHSAANRGIKKANLSEPQIRQLATANKIRNAVEKDWGSLSDSVRNLFGNKKFISDDLFNYIPEVKDGKVHFGGNVVPVSVVMGGGFNLPTNNPVDRDVMEMIQEAIKRSQKGNK